MSTIFHPLLVPGSYGFTYTLQIPIIRLFLFDSQWNHIKWILSYILVVCFVLVFVDPLAIRTMYSIEWATANIADG